MTELNASVFDSFPILETDRLLLRPISLTDANAIFKMRTNDRISQFIPRVHLSDLDAAEQLVNKCTEAFQNKAGIAWAAQRKGTDEIIGTCGYNSVNFQNRRLEIGGEMSTDFWGKKLAQEALEKIIAFGLHELNANTIEAKVSPDNKSAIYLLETFGFIREALFHEYFFFNGKYHNMAVYTLHYKHS